MIDLNKIQKEIYHNKVVKGFNTTDIYKEFCFIQGELSEAFSAYRKSSPELGEELADAVIYLLGLAEILKIDLETTIKNKVAKNKKREYKDVGGHLVRTKDA